MTDGRMLSDTEMAFIALVSARRFGAGASPPSLAAPGPAGDAFERAAAAAQVALGVGAGPVARCAALLAVCSQLALDGQDLIGPQGAAAGMIRGIAEGRVEPAELSRWLQDRSVPAATA